MGAVGQRAMEQIAIEEDNRTRRDFHWHCIFVRVGEVDSFAGAIKTAVVVFAQGPDKSMFMRIGDHPEAAILYGGIVHCNPGSS